MDWMNTPLEDFAPRAETGADGKTTGEVVSPHGGGEAQRLVSNFAALVRAAYEGLLSEPDGERYERAGEVPVVRNGRKVYEGLGALALRDLPAVLDALAVLDGEASKRSAEEGARLEERRKERRRELERERRQRKALGEW